LGRKLDEREGGGALVRENEDGKERIANVGGEKRGEQNCNGRGEQDRK